MNQNQSNNDKKPLKDMTKKFHRKEGSLTTLGELFDLRKMLRDKGIKLNEDKGIFKNSGI